MMFLYQGVGIEFTGGGQEDGEMLTHSGGVGGRGGNGVEEKGETLLSAAIVSGQWYTDAKVTHQRIRFTGGWCGLELINSRYIV